MTIWRSHISSEDPRWTAVNAVTADGYDVCWYGSECDPRIIGIEDASDQDVEDEIRSLVAPHGCDVVWDDDDLCIVIHD